MNRFVCSRYLCILISLTLILGIVGCDFSFKPWPPTPSPGKGVIIGKVAPPSHAGFHFTAQDLCLGKLLPAVQTNAYPAVTFTFGDNPCTTVINRNGTFAFTDVVPDTYVLIVWTPENSIVIESPGGGLIKLVVEMDKITDLGTIVLP